MADIFDVVADTTRRDILGVLLDRGPSRDDVVGFLASYPWLVHAALGTDRESDVGSATLGETTLDLAAFSARHSTGDKEYSLVQFGTAGDPLLEGPKPAPYIVELVDSLREARRWVGRNLIAARKTVQDLSPSFHAVVVVGRRDRLTKKETAVLRRYRSDVPPVIVRTYDWILDAAVERSR